MAENSIRMSQLVGTFGPGAMLDLPDRSVLVLGIDQWEMQWKGTFQKIEEPRLQRLLHLRLKDDDRIAGVQNSERRRSTSRTPKRHHPRFARRCSRDGSHATRCPAMRPIAVASFGFRTSTRRSALFTSVLTARRGKSRQSALCAVARTVIFKTSNGVG